MSNDHHHCSASTGGGNKKCDCGAEECGNEKLWTDFEHCAQTVTRLYRDPTWKCLQTAAASTTQLYKSSVDSYKKGFEKGLQSGRTSLAKEVLATFTSGAKLDLNALLEVLYQNIRMSSEERQNLVVPSNVSNETLAAVHLFQQALTTNVSASPTRGDLTSFLSSQMQRHRKRQRSPSSPSVIKKMRR